VTKTFTEFEVYQKSIVLAKEIFRLMNTEKVEKKLSFKDQIKNL
jgi:hypothetical protein